MKNLVVIAIFLSFVYSGCKSSNPNLDDGDLINADTLVNDDADNDLMETKDEAVDEKSDEAIDEIQDTAVDNEVNDEPEDTEVDTDSEVDETVDKDSDLETDDDASDDDVMPEDEMVLIPAGTFMMGRNSALDSIGTAEETPYHEVTLSAYMISIYEVTSEQYQKCVDAGACNNNDEDKPQFDPNSKYAGCNMGDEDRKHWPMNCVSWYGADAYCKWLGKRLPTEAEWEKAARGGCELYTDCTAESFIYPWGNEVATCDYAVINQPSQGGEGCGTGYAWEIGSIEAGKSPYGLYDMAGNAFEWVSDWYDSGYYSTAPDQDPQGSTSGETRSLRGGSYYNDYKLARTSCRGHYYPEIKSYAMGLRCAKDVE